MILTGDKDESDIRTFPNITFERGGIDSFVMTTRRYERMKTDFSYENIHSDHLATWYICVFGMITLVLGHMRLGSWEL